MRLHELNISATKTRKRVGRGISAGGGKTAGRGTKGQNSRSGGQRNPGFEGGQNPLFQRLPKQPGFRSFRKKLQTIQTSDLAKITTKTISVAELHEAGLVSDPTGGTKLLFDTEVKKAFTVKLQGASKKAVESLQKAGGSFEKVALRLEPKGKPAVKAAKSSKRPSQKSNNS